MTESLLHGTYATASIGHSKDFGVAIGLGLTAITTESTFTRSLEFNSAETINSHDTGSGQLIISPPSSIDLYDSYGGNQTGFYGANGSFAISDLESENSELAQFGTRIGTGIQYQGIGIYGAIAFSHTTDRQFAVGTGFYSLHSDGTMVSSFEFNTSSTTNNSGWVDSGTYSVLGSGYAEFELDSGSSPVGYIGSNGSLVAAELDPVKPGLTIIGTKLTYQFDPAAAVGTYGVSVFGNGYFSGKSLLTLTEEQTWSRTMQINSENVTSINTIVDSGTYSVDAQGNLEIFSNSDEASWSVGYIGENGIIIAAELTPSENPVGFFGIKILTSAQSEGVSGNSGDSLNAPISGTADGDLLITTANDDTINGGLGLDTVQFSGFLIGYQISPSGNQLHVSDRNGVDGSDALYSIERLKFQDMTVNLTIQQVASTTVSETLTRLTELYVAFFNRVPDADGLEYWIGQIQAGQSINSIAESFYSAGVQYTDLTGFSPTMTNADFVNVIYRNVLGRADGADADGLAYWTEQLVSGNATRGSLVSTILDSAHTFKGNATWGWVADLLDNKIAVSQQFAVNWGLNYNTPEDSIAKGMAIAAAITPTDTDAAIALIGIAPGQIQLI